MIGIRIAELRKSRGMSQKALGDKLHVTQGAVSQWENERTLPDTQQQRAIASFFDVSLDYLLGLSNDPKAISQSYAMAASLDASADMQRSPASDDDLKFALFGSSKDITDAQFEEVKRFAQFIKERGNR